MQSSEGKGRKVVLMVPFNPFNLKGPQFLLFYISLGILLLIVLRVVRQFSEDDGIDRRDIFNDPLSIACLRDGTGEVIRVAVMSLLDRGLLIPSGITLAAREGAEAIARKPIERGILKKCQTPVTASTLVEDPELLAICEAYEDELKKQRLLPDDVTGRMRDRLFRASLFILWGVAGTKIAVALSRGKTNIIFLIILAIILPMISYAIIRSPFRSIKGDRALSHLKEVFKGLKARAANIPTGGGTTDIVILAAVFGLLHLPESLSAQARLFFPKLQPSSSSGGSSCGSGCGSSSSSSCGGGGGCGGGGCGGCG